MPKDKSGSASKSLVIAGAGVIVVLLAVALLGHAANLGSLTISASGTATGTPSKAVLNIEFKGTGATAYAATTNLSLELNKANATLYNYIDGNLSNIQTSYYSLYNQSGYYGGYYPIQKGNLTGYVATESLTVTIPEIRNVSRVLGALGAINGIYIYGATATFTDAQLASLKNTALTLAVSNATAQAHALLPGKNLTINNITVGYYYPIMPLAYGTGAVASAGPAQPATPVNIQFFSGTQQVTQQVTVGFNYNK